METDNAIEMEEIEAEEPDRRLPVWMLTGAVLVAVLFVLLRPTPDLPSTAVGSSTTSSALTLEPSVNLPPIAVAAAFVDAYGNFNDDLAASFLAHDAEVSRLEGGQGHWRLDNRWLEAVGFKLDLVSCESMGSSASGVRVHCVYAFHALGSDATDLGSFEGWFDLRVRDGRIVWAFQTWHPGMFLEQVWGAIYRLGRRDLSA